MNADDDLLFHYDCTPAYIRSDHPSPGYDATAAGLRGAAVAAVIIEHANTDQEA